MLKKAFLTVLLLAAVGCTTKNYYPQCEMPAPHDGPDHAAHSHPRPDAPSPAPIPGAMSEGSRTQYYTSKPYMKDAGAPYGMKTEWKNNVPPADWDPNGPKPDAMNDYREPPRPSATASEKSSYEWNKHRKERKEGEYFKPTPPGAAGLNGGQLIDPLSFPHFCGPGARSRGAC